VPGFPIPTVDLCAFGAEPPPPAVAPTLTDLSPDTSELGDPVTVTLTGTGFTPSSSVRDAARPEIGELPSVYVSDTQLTVTFTPVATGTGQWYVTNHGLASAQLPFTVTGPPPPVITSFTPATGVIGRPIEPLTITGTDFAPNARVLVDGTVRFSDVVSATSITLDFRPTLASHAFQVQNPDDALSSAVATFTSTAPPVPVLTSISPNPSTAYSFDENPTGLTITGENFEPGSMVLVDQSIDGQGIYVSPTQMTLSWNRPVGEFDIRVSNGPGATSNTIIEVVLPDVPVLTSLTPNTGTVGVAVTVEAQTDSVGTYSTIRADGVALPTTYSPVTGNLRTTYTPLTAGTKQITVSNGIGASGSEMISAALPFTVAAAAPPDTPTPTLTDAQPPNVPVAATVITLTGTGFVAGSKVKAIAPQGANTPYDLVTTFVSATSLTATIGPEQLVVGQGMQVWVQNPDGDATTGKVISVI